MKEEIRYLIEDAIKGVIIALVVIVIVFGIMFLVEISETLKQMDDKLSNIVFRLNEINRKMPQS